MPNKLNAEKALRQSKKRQIRNDNTRHTMYDIKRKIKKAVAENSVKDLEKLLKEAQIILDKAAKNNVIKKNSAARRKASLAKIVNSKAVEKEGEVKKVATKKTTAKKTTTKAKKATAKKTTTKSTAKKK